MAIGRGRAVGEAPLAVLLRQAVGEGAAALAAEPGVEVGPDGRRDLGRQEVEHFGEPAVAELERAIRPVMPREAGTAGAVASSVTSHCDDVVAVAGGDEALGRAPVNAANRG
jgi:hypothetical protein